MSLATLPCEHLHIDAPTGKLYCRHKLYSSPAMPIPADLCGRCRIRSIACVSRPTPVIMATPLGERIARAIDRWLGVPMCPACERRKAWLNAAHIAAVRWRDRLLKRLRLRRHDVTLVLPVQIKSPCAKAGKVAPCGQQGQLKPPATALVPIATIAARQRPAAANPFPDVTFCITSFERPTHLANLITSIDRHYPGVRIVVADCSATAPAVPAHVELVRLPYDAGLSAMRKALVDRLQTKFLLLLEEDFIFTAETKIFPLLDVLAFDGEVGCCAGSMRIVGLPGVQDYAIDLDGFRDVLHGLPATRPVRFTAGGSRPPVAYQYADKVLNFALYRREMLARHDWSGLPKVGEHAAYFLQVKQAGQWRAAHTSASIVQHDTSGRTDNYRQHRGRASLLQREWHAANGFARGYRQAPGLDGPIITTGSMFERPNMILMGVGHSGTTVAARMLEKLGWSLGDANEEFAESVSVHALNEPVPMHEYNAGAGHDAWKLDVRAATEALKRMPRPWCIKDPRWIYALPSWLPLLAEYRPVLLWLRRDSAAVADSFVRRGELPVRGIDEDPLATVTIRLAAAREVFESWPQAWGRLAIDYESLAAAVGLFSSPQARSS